MNSDRAQPIAMIVRTMRAADKSDNMRARSHRRVLHRLVRLGRQGEQTRLMTFLDNLSRCEPRP